MIQLAFGYPRYFNMHFKKTGNAYRVPQGELTV